MIKKCDCTWGREGKYQDEKYGKGMRVHNAAPSKVHKGKFDYVCTVCGTRKTGD